MGVQKKSNLEIDMLKFLFSIVVVLCHWGKLLNGGLAVEFFFIVSGYFFAKSIIAKQMYGGGTF